MIRRLVQQHDVRLFPGELGEREAALLTAAEKLHRLGGELAGEPEPPEVGARRLQRHLRVERLHVRDAVLLQVHALEVVLREARQTQLGVPVDPALRGQDVALEQFQEGGLTGAVGANDGDAAVHVEAEVQALVQGLVSVSYTHLTLPTKA